MPTQKSTPKSAKPAKKSKAPAKPTSVKLDILFSGPLLFVPEIIDGNIASVEVYSPNNGHPIGAIFLPGVFFSDAELNDPQCARWPEPSSFSLLDPHSYAIDLTQQLTNEEGSPLPATAIPETNHKIKQGRKLSHDWELAISVNGHLSAWGSHRLFHVTGDLYCGADAPTTATTAAMHRLTYNSVTAAEFCGASPAHKEYLRANAAKGGSLIILGEIPYQSTLSHERRAIDALAKLAGLDLHLVATEPNPHKTRMMIHTGDCGHSIIVV